MAQQKLMIITESQTSLNSFLTTFEETLLENFGDYTLRKFGDKVYFNLIEVGSQKVVEFLGT
jgi:hypothetical protein